MTLYNICVSHLLSLALYQAPMSFYSYPSFIFSSVFCFLCCCNCYCCLTRTAPQKNAFTSISHHCFLLSPPPTTLIFIFIFLFFSPFLSRFSLQLLFTLFLFLLCFSYALLVYILFFISLASSLSTFFTFTNPSFYIHLLLCVSFPFLFLLKLLFL